MQYIENLCQTHWQAFSLLTSLHIDSGVTQVAVAEDLSTVSQTIGFCMLQYQPDRQDMHTAARATQMLRGN